MLLNENSFIKQGINNVNKKINEFGLMKIKFIENNYRSNKRIFKKDK